MEKTFIVKDKYGDIRFAVENDKECFDSSVGSAENSRWYGSDYHLRLKAAKSSGVVVPLSDYTPMQPQ